MEIIIRLMTGDDKNIIMDMMYVFYASPAVLSNGSEEIFAAGVTLYTRSILPMVFWHGICDLAAFLPNGLYP